MSSQCVLYWNG